MYYTSAEQGLSRITPFLVSLVEVSRYCNFAEQVLSRIKHLFMVSLVAAQGIVTLLSKQVRSSYTPFVVVGLVAVCRYCKFAEQVRSRTAPRARYCTLLNKYGRGLHLVQGTVHVPY